MQGQCEKNDVRALRHQDIHRHIREAINTLWGMFLCDGNVNKALKVDDAHTPIQFWRSLVPMLLVGLVIISILRLTSVEHEVTLWL